MELRIVDFEKLSIHYKKYRDGLNMLEFIKSEYLKQIEPIKKEMNDIIASMQSGLVMDNRTQKEKAERFQSLQEQVSSIDKDATTQLSKFRDKMTKEVYSEMEEIITEWSKSNNIDLVMGKIECVYAKEEFEITDSILEAFKTKELYVESLQEKVETLEENEKESV
jgi:Skp family chaperone for outer membrane proteins